MIFRRIFGYVLLSQKIFGRKLKIFENSDYSHWHPIRWFINGSRCQQFYDQERYIQYEGELHYEYVFDRKIRNLKSKYLCNRDGKSRFIMSTSASVLQKTWLENMLVRSCIDFVWSASSSYNSLWGERGETNKHWVFCLPRLSAQSVPSHNTICKLFARISRTGLLMDVRW